MNVFHLLKKKLTIPQWNIGIARGSITEVVKNGKFSLRCSWFAISKAERFFADPFICKSPDGQIHVLYEDYDDAERYGKIAVAVLDDALKPVHTRTLLDTGSHLSYPFVFIENKITYIIPESADSGGVYCYEFDFTKLELVNKKTILPLPIFDSTIVKHEGRYWLFGTMYAKDSSSMLYIYYADRFGGPYTSHTLNPVKNSLKGSRPAGSFIEMDGMLYRPSQNSEEEYGKSITLHKIKTLTTDEFEEEFYTILHPNQQDTHSLNLHTINAVDDLVVIDGASRHFAPGIKWRSFLKKFRAAFS